MINKNFLEYVKNKKVVIVGPANYILNFNNGDYIDSYDIVVRINRGVELTNIYPNSLGTKTNILYNCMVESPDNGGIININFLKKHRLDWICTLPRCNYQGLSKSNRLPKEASVITYIKLKLNFNFHMMSHLLLTNLNKKINSRSNTGFASIFDILLHDPKEIFITGFSFYLDSFIKKYKEGSLRNEDDFAEDCFNSKRHNQFNQWNYLKKKSLEYNSKLKFDYTLEKILKMKNFTKEEFKQIEKN